MPESTPVVEYRDIAGYPGYRVGSDGSVWSCRTSLPGVLSSSWHKLTLGKHSEGYRWIALRATPGGKQTVLYLHRLILESFVGPCPPGQQALHGDDDTSNNTLGNLRWGTRADNVEDALRNGKITCILDWETIFRKTAASLKADMTLELCGMLIAANRLSARQRLHAKRLQKNAQMLLMNFESFRSALSVDT